MIWLLPASHSLDMTSLHVLLFKVNLHFLYMCLIRLDKSSNLQTNEYIQLFAGC